MPAATANMLSPSQAARIFEDMSDGIVLVNSDGNITYVNSACEAIFGFKKDEVIGKGVGRTLAVDKKNIAFNEMMTDAIGQAKPTRKKLVDYRRKDGENRKLSVDISLMSENGLLKKGDAYRGMIIHVGDETAHYRIEQMSRDCTYIFTGLIVCLCLYLSIWSLCRFTLGVRFSNSDYTLMIEGMSFILFLEIIIFTSFRFRDIGLAPNVKRLKKNIGHTLAIGILMSSFLILLRGFIIFRYKGSYGKDYFIGGSWAGAGKYILTALFQEFLARGVMQTSVQILLQSKNRRWLSILLTSMLFSLMHLPFGFMFMLGAFSLSIALGIVYDKQGDLWGCALLHWGCGYLAMCLFF